MTPVQLPEVPAREVVAHHIHGTEAEVLAFRLDMRNLLPGDLIGQSVHVLTADQLRAYATEAIRQAANAIFAEGWYLACDWMERDDLKFDVDSPAFEADRAARLGNLLNQPEQNSGR